MSTSNDRYSSDDRFLAIFLGVWVSAIMIIFLTTVVFAVVHFI